MKEDNKLSDLTITLSCNNNCVFCPRDILSLILHDRKSSKFKDQLKKIRAQSDSINLTGGEITVLPDIFDIFKICKELGFKKISIITNARMASYKKYAEKLSRYVNSAGVSVYSIDKNVHDKISRVSGSLKQTLQGLKNLLDNIEHIWVNITVSRINSSTLARTMKDLYEIGVREFLIISVISENKDYIYNKNVIREEFNKINKATLKESLITLRGFDQESTQDIGNSREKEIRIEDHAFNTFYSEENNENYYKHLDGILNEN